MHKSTSQMKLSINLLIDPGSLDSGLQRQLVRLRRRDQLLQRRANSALDLQYTGTTGCPIILAQKAFARAERARKTVMQPFVKN